VSSEKSSKRQQPVRIPLSFDDALGGLLRVDPKKLPASTKRRAVKQVTNAAELPPEERAARALPKPAKKVAKKGKSNRNNQAKG
jgi:hypothetical protein